MDNRRNRRPMPTFNDKFSVRDRLPPDMFGDARRQLHDDVWGRADLDWPTRGFGGRLGSLGRHFGADVDNLRRRFHDLKPRAPTVAEFGSCDSLDEDSARSLILEDSHSKSRTFEVIFNVRDYTGGDITVRVCDYTLMVTVQQTDPRDSRRKRQFSRQVALPSEVDPGVLSSVLSDDGVLTVYAPLPPAYNNVVYCRGHSGAPSRVNTPHKAGSPKTSAAPEGRCSPSNAPSTTRTPPCGSGGSIPSGIASPTNTTRFPYSPKPEVSRSPYATGFLHPNDPRRTFSDSADRNDHKPDIQGGPRSASPFSRAGFADEIPREDPVFTTQSNGQRRMRLKVNIGPIYHPDDIVVNVDDLKLSVEAVHEDVRDSVVSKTSMSRQFDLKEPIDGDSVDANLSGGVLTVTALATPPSQ